MDKKVRYLSGAVMCAAGGAAMKMFLVSEKWATVWDFSYVQNGYLISAHPFNIGYHWTTCLGMLGVVFLIRGVMQIVSKEEKYPAGSAAASLFLGNICAWDLFDSISETYYGLFLGWDNRVMDICRILQAASFLAAAALVCVIFWRRGERKNGRTYQLLGALLLLTAGGSLFIRTFCNMWFFWQTAAAAGLTAMACGGRAWKRQMEKRRKRREWRVITNV